MTSPPDPEWPVAQLLTFTDRNTIKLEYFQGPERLLEISVSRNKIREWAMNMLQVADTHFVFRK